LRSRATIAALTFVSFLVLAGCTAPPCVDPQVVRPGGEQESVLHLVLSPDSHIAALQPHTEDFDGSVELIDLTSRKQVASFPAEQWGGLPPVFSPSGAAVVVPAGGGFAVHRVPSGELAFRIGRTGPFAPHEVWFGDEGRTVLALWNAVADTPYPEDLVRYDAATGKELDRHPWAEPSVVLTPGGRYTVAIPDFGRGGQVTVRDARTGEQLAKAVLPESDAKVQGAWRVVVAPGDARAYVYRDPHDHPEGEILAFDLPTLRERFRVPCKGWEQVSAPSAGQLVLSGLDAAVTIDAATGRVVAEWDCGWALSRHEPGELVFCADGSRAAGICPQGRSGEFHVWELATGRRLATLARDFGGTVVHFFKDGRRVLTRALDPLSEHRLPFEGTEVIYRLFDAGTGRELARYEPHRSGTGCITDDESLLVWTVGGTVNAAPIPGVSGLP
jgi:hypothetical protein